jgi:ubiquinone/menaquinone biosynthesis C-methylase UbiE
MAADSYLDFTSYYDSLFGRVLGGLRAVVARVVAPKKGMHILDIGCGTGAQLAIFQESGCDVFGIDLSLPMLRIARRKLGDQAVLANADATNIPFPEQAFDLVTSSLFLHQLNPNARAMAIEEALRVVRRDGRILFIDFHPGPVKSIRGKLTQFIISSVEFIAGREHFSNSRDFLSRGGVPSLASNHGLKVEKELFIWDGNLGIYLLNLEQVGTAEYS